MGKRNLVSQKSEVLFRYFLTYGLSQFLPFYIVTEYPKSGGTWLSQIISDYLEIPFPRNEWPSFFKPSLLHGHYSYFPTMNNVFLMVRDGRDVIVSMYFHFYFKNDRYNERGVEYHRENLPFKDYEDVGNNLPRFIEHKFENPRHPRFTWVEFLESWLDKDVPIVKYENMLESVPEEVGSALEEVTGQQPDYDLLEQLEEKYSFENQTGLERGEEGNSGFMRKGIAGDWKNHFNKEARETFNDYAGDMLIKLGYEVDHSWVEEI